MPPFTLDISTATYMGAVQSTGYQETGTQTAAYILAI